MATEGKKGLTVQLPLDLHAEVKQYVESNNMTMAEFVILALNDELHPKYQEKEENNMANMRTLAFQVPEDLFQRIKDYLRRNNMTQKEFVIGLIESEIERDLTAREAQDISKSTVKRAIADLVKSGYIRTEQRYRKTGAKSSLLFTVNNLSKASNSKG